MQYRVPNYSYHTYILPVTTLMSKERIHQMLTLSDDQLGESGTLSQSEISALGDKLCEIWQITGRT